MTAIDLTLCDVIETPFAHVRNSAFVAPQVYDILRRTFPQCPPGDGPSGYSLWSGDDSYQRLLAAHAEWQALHDAFHSQQFIDWAIVQFAEVWQRQGCKIDPAKARFVPYQEDGVDKVRRHLRKVELAPHELWVRMDINQGQVGYSRPIHRDWPRRLVSMLVYMCDHTETAAQGGELVLHPVPWKRWTQQPVVVTPRENLMVAFPCSGRSYHSVPRISAIARPRNYLQVLISSSVDAWTHRDPTGRALTVLGAGARKTLRLATGKAW
jgi:hypothetical protein